MTLTVHLGSFIVGACFGLLLSISAVYFGEEWHVGFSHGWECGAEYQKKKEEKENFISQVEAIKKKNKRRNTNGNSKDKHDRNA